MKKVIVSVAAMAAFLAWPNLAAAQQEEDPSLTAEVVNSEGESLGTVTFRQLEHGVVVVADLSGLPAGPHGFHVHERGVCETPDFQSAGGHYSPAENVHGFDSPDGYHVGDLPNLHVMDGGTAMGEFFTPFLAVVPPAEVGEGAYSLQDESGSAIMIHQDVDDYMASTENSTGPRIACGVIAEPQG